MATKQRQIALRPDNKKRSSKLDKVKSRPRKDNKLKKDIQTFFGGNSDKILELLEDDNNDSAMSLLQKRLLQTVIKLLPLAENIMVDTGSQRGTYQFVSMVTLCQNLMQDIRAANDKKYVAKHIAQQALIPMCMEMVQKMLDAHYAYGKQIQEYVKPTLQKQAQLELNQVGKDLSKELQILCTLATDKIETILKS